MVYDFVQSHAAAAELIKNEAAAGRWECVAGSERVKPVVTKHSSTVREAIDGYLLKSQPVDTTVLTVPSQLTLAKLQAAPSADPSIRTSASHKFAARMLLELHALTDLTKPSVGSAIFFEVSEIVGLSTRIIYDMAWLCTLLFSKQVLPLGSHITHSSHCSLLVDRLLASTVVPPRRPAYRSNHRRQSVLIRYAFRVCVSYQSI